MRANALWAVFGNSAYQASQLLSVLIIARILGTETLGFFSLALAVCTPITSLSTLGLRNLQVVDVENRFDLSDFRRVQLFTSAIGVVFALAAASFIENTEVALIIIAAVYLSQAINSQRDTFLAYFQKSRRMDLVACSRLAGSAFSIAACAMAAAVTADLFATILAIAISRLCVMYWYDRPKCLSLGASVATRNISQITAKCRSIILTSIPLGVANGLLALEVSLPRLFLDSALGTNSLGQLTILTTLAMPIPFVMSSASQAILPYLARSGVETSGLVIRLHLLVALLSTLAVALSWHFGTDLLKLFMGKEYFALEHELALAIISGYFAAAASVSSYAFIARKRFAATLVLNTCSFTAVLACSYALIPDMGLTGSLIASMAGRLVVLIGTTFLFIKQL